MTSQWWRVGLMKVCKKFAALLGFALNNCCFDFCFDMRMPFFFILQGKGSV